jgi:hypothetical protein
VTAEQESVHVRVWLDGIEALDRHFQAARRAEVDLLAEAIEAGGHDPIADGSIRMAAALAGADISHGRNGAASQQATGTPDDRPKPTTADRT